MFFFQIWYFTWILNYFWVYWYSATLPGRRWRDPELFCLLSHSLWPNNQCQQDVSAISTCPKRTLYVNPMVLLNESPLKAVNTFKYLGSTVALGNTLDAELDYRAKAAALSFSKIKDRPEIRLSTKYKVYRAVIWSGTTLLCRDLHSLQTSFRQTLYNPPKTELYHQSWGSLEEIEWQTYKFLGESTCLALNPCWPRPNSNGLD